MPFHPINPDQVHNGILALTFDDSHCEQWLAQLPRFSKYRAHATFFFHKTIDDRIIETMKALRSAGHSIGIHTLNHCDAVPGFESLGPDKYIEQEVLSQLNPLNAAGVPIDLMAYPNNIRNDETDRILGRYFRHFRAGMKGAKLPDGIRQILPLDQIAKTPALGGFGIGEYYHTNLDELEQALCYAAKENRLLTFFSHGISPNAPSIHMPEDTLEFLLEKAQKLGMICAGFDQLP